MPKFSNIAKLPRAAYEVHVSWTYLEERIKKDTEELNLNLNPQFQRAHIWTKKQQTAYIEYQLMGGEVGKNLTFNHPGWMKKWEGEYEIIDGKQRLEAVRAFLRNEVKAFGHYYKEYEDKLHFMDNSFNWRVCCLNSREDVLKLYLNINAGGTPHTKAELDKVRKMLGELQNGKLNQD